MTTSIIILSFNNYEETTGKCLAALSKDPDFHFWEIIVVDNASNTETLKKLKEAQQLYPNVNFVFNSHNAGFAAGNNIGIKIANGKIIVLLNSDAFPTPGMISRLCSHFDHEPDLGMVGPITNAAGNEQCIFAGDGDENDKTTIGLAYAEAGLAHTLSAYRLDFFCVAISRAAVNRVGLLDEEFGRGYYEDLDYSLLVKNAGFKLGVAENVFVYHRGSTSFGKMPDETKSLLKRNKRLVSQKHGTGVLFQHVRQTNLAILAQYAKKNTAELSTSKYCISNRLMLAKREMPRSFFKRWRYLRQLEQTIKKLHQL